MTRMFLSAVALCAAAGTVQAENIVSPFSQLDQVWQLSTLSGVAFDKNATLIFGSEGSVAGSATCNRFTGRADWSSTSLSIGPLAMTRMACPDMDQERVVMQALSAVRSGGIIDDTLVLTLSDGSSMVYLPASGTP